MKRKVTAVIMIMLLTFGIMTLTGCGRNDGTDDLSQTPNNADDNLTNDNMHDDGIMDNGPQDGLDDDRLDDNRNDDNDLADDIRDGADDVTDDVRDALDGKDETGKNNDRNTMN